MKNFLFATILFFHFSSFSQMESNHWLFCDGVRMDFSTNPPLVSGTHSDEYEGTSAISDPVTGQLLFYCDGDNVFDRVHNSMPNGSGLTGNYSSTQSSIIVPQPGSSTRYYVFTNDSYENLGALGFRYTVVDMSLHGGMGDVDTTEKNVLLFAPSAEQLSAIPNEDCSGWWIVTKQVGNNSYNAYLLNSAGLSPPVVSSLGITPISWLAGQAKFSPDGKKYAICSTHSYAMQLFDFDKSTGILSNPTVLFNMGVGGSHQPYGTSFSADNSKLYFTDVSNNGIYQYDLSTGTAATIIASKTLVGTCPRIAQMQLARNHKIYISTGFYISVINFPNQPGATCGFSPHVHPLPNPSGPFTIGLTNFPDNFSNHFNPCDTVFQAIVSTQNVSCKGYNNGMASIEINNGMPPYSITWLPSGSTNDTLFNLGPGTYTVQVTDALGNHFADTVTITQPALPLSVSINISPNDTVCFGNVLQVQAVPNGGVPGYGYSWYPYINEFGDDHSEAIFASEVITVQVTDNNGCHATDSINIFVTSSAPPEAIDQVFCEGENIMLTVPSISTWSWSTGDTGPSISIAPTGDTIITVAHYDPCLSSTTFNLDMAPPFSLSLSLSEDTLCPEEDLQVTAAVTPAGHPVSYTWPGAGDTTNTYLFYPEQTACIAVIVTDGLCTKTDSACFIIRYDGCIPVPAPITIIVPNIITPNGDGINDVFRIDHLPGHSALSIFNRWGNPVLATGNYQNGWAGDSDGVYYYVLRLADGKVFSGFVQVMGN